MTKEDGISLSYEKKNNNTIDDSQILSLVHLHEYLPWDKVAVHKLQAT